MATLGTYYIDADKFEDATAVYTNVNLTTKAADGYYQSCGIYRQQTSGLLGNPTTCPFCSGGVCGTLPSGGWATTEQGIYTFDISLNSAGAWKVGITPVSLPNSIQVEFPKGSGTFYTGGSSSNFGWLDGPYYGDTPTATAYDFPNRSPYLVSDFEWQGDAAGTSFSPTGTSQSLNIAPADFSGTAGAPGDVVMFIPKLTADVEEARITVNGPIGGQSEAFSLTNLCPAPLVGFLVGSGQATQPLACASGVVNTYYNGPVTGTDGDPGLHDIMYANSNAGITLASVVGIGPGTTQFFKFESASFPAPVGGYFELDENSVIVSIGSC